MVYSSVNNIVAKLEREHFGREEENDTSSLLLDGDLLILDDLGTEFRTAFSVAEIYNIVNTRQMAQRPAYYQHEPDHERNRRALHGALCLAHLGRLCASIVLRAGCSPTKADARRRPKQPLTLLPRTGHYFSIGHGSTVCRAAVSRYITHIQNKRSSGGNPCRNCACSYSVNYGYSPGNYYASP